jgi:peptide-methionine (S)-S-oxide reductase
MSEALVLGGGCFWCLDPLFNRIEGVHSVESGYAGGRTLHPTYADICTGTTGHAEVLRLRFDPTVVSLETLLTVFFVMHDPTTLNRQGNDRGTQYRSIVFYRDEETQKRIKDLMASLEAEAIWPDPWVTEVVPEALFYPAEDYHQRYYETHGHEPYCAFVISPKLEKFYSKFKTLLKKEG